MPYANINETVNRDEPLFQLHWAPMEAGGTAQLAFNVPISMAQEQVRVTLKESEEFQYPEGVEPAFTFYSNSLSRFEINQMIKTLRRMRNAVYGADE